MPAPADLAALVRPVGWPGARRLLLWLGVLACSRVWAWRETVPDWLWVVVLAAGWACVRSNLRAKLRADGPAGAGVAASEADSSRPARTRDADTGPVALEPGMLALGAWAVACGASAYSAHLSLAPGFATPLALVLLGGAAFCDPALRSAWRTAAGVFGLVAASVGLALGVLVRAVESEAAYELVALGSAWTAGFSVAGGVAALLCGLQPLPFGTPPMRGAPWESDAKAVWHGRLLVAAAACVPLGEGLALVVLGLLGVTVAVRRRHLAWDLLRGTPAVRGMGWGMACWALAGACALVVGKEGWLKPSELGRWVPYLAVVLPILSAGAVPRRYFAAAAGAFLGALLIACGVGLLMYGFDLRPGNGALAFLRAPSDQSRVPGLAREVAGGFYFHRLKMAHVLLPGIAALAVRQVGGPLAPRRRAWELAALAMFGATLFFTFARGAWLGLGIVWAVCACMTRGRVRRAWLGLALVLALGVGASPAVRARLLSAADPAASAIRATVWEQAVLVLREHPWGVGLGNYTPVIGRYYDRLANGREFPKTYPHNMILAAWAETGPVGLAGYALAWVIFLKTCLVATLRRRPDDPGRATWAAAGLAAGAALWVVGLTHDVLFHNAVALAFCGMAGLVTARLIAPADA